MTQRTCDDLGVCRALPVPCSGCTGLHCQQARHPERCDCGYLQVHAHNSDGTDPHAADDIATADIDVTSDHWTWVDDLKDAALAATAAATLSVVIGLATGAAIAHWVRP